jgi:carotenoid cleavage dioxygenase-like enzyme
VADAGLDRVQNPGVLLSVVFDSGSGRSLLVVLDAGDLSEMARAHGIPYGFHGQVVRDAA